MTNWRIHGVDTVAGPGELRGLRRTITVGPNEVAVVSLFSTSGGHIRGLISNLPSGSTLVYGNIGDFSLSVETAGNWTVDVKLPASSQ